MSSREITAWMALARVEAEERGDMGPPPPDEDDLEALEAEQDEAMTSEEQRELDDMDRLIAMLEQERTYGGAPE